MQGWVDLATLKSDKISGGDDDECFLRGILQWNETVIRSSNSFCRAAWLESHSQSGSLVWQPVHDHDVEVKVRSPTDLWKLTIQHHAWPWNWSQKWNRGGWRTLRGEGHSAIVRLDGTLVDLSGQWPQTAGPKSVHYGNGRPPIALRCPLLMLVSTPLRTANHCCSGFPVSGRIQMSAPLALNRWTGCEFDTLALYEN